MGWWKIKDVESGQVDFKHKAPGVSTELVNAIPGQETDEDALYNGDGPADAMADALDKISEQYETAWGRPAKKEELTAAFNFVCNGRFRKKDKE